MNAHRDCVLMESGRWVSLATPNPTDIHLPDIAAHLSRINRFNGATRGVTYSVAQHSVLGCRLVGLEARPYFILHDGHEALVGDQISPVKRFIRAASEEYDIMVDRLDAAIHEAAGLSWPIPRDIQEEIDHADAVMQATEFRDLMPPLRDDSSNLPAAANFRIKPWPWPWPMAEEKFLNAMGEYLPHGMTRDLI